MKNKKRKKNNPFGTHTDTLSLRSTRNMVGCHTCECMWRIGGDVSKDTQTLFIFFFIFFNINILRTRVTTGRCGFCFILFLFLLSMSISVSVSRSKSLFAFMFAYTIVKLKIKLLHTKTFQSMRAFNCDRILIDSRRTGRIPLDCSAQTYRCDDYFIFVCSLVSMWEVRWFVRVLWLRVCL